MGVKSGCLLLSLRITGRPSDLNRYGYPATRLRRDFCPIYIKKEYREALVLNVSYMEE